MTTIIAILAALLVAVPASAYTWELSPDGTYRITVGPITETEFVAYLNASHDAEGDYCGYFYTGAMAGAGITRSGSQGSYSYGGGSGSPVVGITLHAAMAYTNYQDTGSESSGSYDPLAPAEASNQCGYGTGGTAFPERDAGTDFWIPSYDEWTDATPTTTLDEELTDTYLGSGGYKTTDATTIGIASTDGDRGFRLAAPIVDEDDDGAGDACDACAEDDRNVGTQDCDADDDGYGNVCDPDFDQSHTTNTTDYTMFFVPAFSSGNDSGRGEDMDCSGGVNATDFTDYFNPMFKASAPPGPSGLSCAGTPGCN